MFGRFRDELREVGRRLPENLVVLRTATSTNEVARRLLKALPEEVSPVPRSFVVAYEQSRGRGRMGRHWHSAAGAGLYCSLLEPLDGAEEGGRLPLSVAVALCQAAHAAGVAGCRLKWPNDLVVGGRKLGGILIEVVASRAAPATAIIGFGINLGDADAQLAELGATTMALEGGRVVTAGALLDLVASQLRSVLFERLPDGEVVARYRHLLRHRIGEELSWRQGGETMRGRYNGVDDSGHLVLDTAEGRRAVAVGDIIEP